MTAPELKPCPFCGEKMPPHDDTSWVRCYGCGAETGWRPTGDEAAAAWNTRADWSDKGGENKASLLSAWNTRADLHDATKAQLAKAVEALRACRATFIRCQWDEKSVAVESINAVLAEIEKGGA